MLNRRDFIKSFIAASGLAVLPVDLDKYLNSNIPKLICELNRDFRGKTVSFGAWINSGKDWVHFEKTMVVSEEDKIEIDLSDMENTVTKKFYMSQPVLAVTSPEQRVVDNIAKGHDQLLDNSGFDNWANGSC